MCLFVTLFACFFLLPRTGVPRREEWMDGWMGGGGGIILHMYRRANGMRILYTRGNDRTLCTVYPNTH